MCWVRWFLDVTFDVFCLAFAAATLTIEQCFKALGSDLAYWVVGFSLPGFCFLMLVFNACFIFETQNGSLFWFPKLWPGASILVPWGTILVPWGTLRDSGSSSKDTRASAVLF